MFLLLLSAALAFDIVLPTPQPATLTEAEAEALRESVRDQVPAGGGPVRVLARGPDGRLRSLESFVPPLPPPPSKGVLQRTHPADLQGQGEGFLSGREVYLSGSHGWIWFDSLDAFSVQRPNLFGTVEDFHNPEALNQYLCRYLENAGAAVFTVRERDLQTHMAIADNDGEGYSEKGSGFANGNPGFADRGSWEYGEDPFDAGTTRTFPADGGGVATWIPDVPADGTYAVYVTWDTDAGNATDAHYRLTWAGGVIDRVFDQTVHGSTWQYVETLWLEEGPESLVVELLGDSASSGRKLSADAVRIGGGWGDVIRHDQITDRPRWEEGAISSTQWNGAPTDVYDPYGDGNGSDPSSRSRWAAWEHPSGPQALYLSWHSNAGGGTGTSTYYYEGDYGDAVEGSDLLAQNVQEEVVNAVQSLWDPAWDDRGVYTDAFSETNPSHNPDMPAALVEVAFHDNEYDASLLKEPDFRRDLSRALYRALVRTFAERAGETPRYLPEPPDHLGIVHDGQGHLRVTWSAGPSGDPYGDAATSYRVQTSPDGKAWDLGTEATGTSHTLDTPVGGTVFVRVAAVNEGGASFPSEVVGARRAAEGTTPILVVSAFDRLQESSLITEDLGGDIGVVDRMYLDRMNTFDTSVPLGLAVSDLGWPFDTVSDESFDDLDLTPYRLVLWVAGEESTADTTFTSDQQDRLRAFWEAGGALWATGSEILWDLDYRGSDTDKTFAREVLGATMASDDAETWSATGADLLEGLDLSFGEEHGAPYPAEYPDVLDSDRTVVATYAGGDVAGVLGDRVAFFGFPFECIGKPSSRREVAARILPALLPDYSPDTTEPDDTGVDDPTDSGWDPGPGVPPPGEMEPLEQGGCGCGGSTPAGWGVLLAALALGRRRRVV